ncbi:hypothetical protein BGX38DRAFT_842812 [Terfezia claveryi]|nr:hypothetical protein BGX38DRAFT_842812 [Terfezia claveryi]
MISYASSSHRIAASRPVSFPVHPPPPSKPQLHHMVIEGLPLRVLPFFSVPAFPHPTIFDSSVPHSQFISKLLILFIVLCGQHWKADHTTSLGLRHPCPRLSASLYPAYPGQALSISRPLVGFPIQVGPVFANGLIQVYSSPCLTIVLDQVDLTQLQYSFLTSALPDLPAPSLLPLFIP